MTTIFFFLQNNVDRSIGDGTKELILETLENKPNKRPSASEIVSRLKLLKVNDKSTKKPTQDTSRWDYLLNLYRKWDYAQVWEVAKQSSAEDNKNKKSEKLFTDCIVKKYELEFHQTLSVTNIYILI